MVKYASGKKIYTATPTNAHYLNDEHARRTVESGLDRLIISIDGTTQEVYSQYRIGGQIKKSAGRGSQYSEMGKEAQQQNAFCFFPVFSRAAKLTRYRKKPDGSYESKNQLNNHCWRLWHSPVIIWDGLVVPCCFDKDATHRMGDLKKKSFKEI